MKKSSASAVVVFGDRRFAQLLHFCLVHDSPWKVVGFTVDAAWRKADRFEGLPLVDFETLESRFPPGEVKLFIPAGFQRLNGLRRERFESAKQRGYAFASYVSSRASVWPGFEAGPNGLIYEHAIVQPFTTIGENVTVRSGAHISHHCRIESHAFISAEVAMAGDVHVGEQAFIGIGAVLKDGLRIAPRSFIGAGAVVVRDTEEGAAYAGNPARKLAKRAADLC